MSDEFDFDFDIDENGVVIDNEAKTTNTDKNQASTPKKAVAKKSGKSSGKSSGKTTRQQERVPMYVRQPLSADSRPGFVRRVVNDVPGRIDRMKLAGWTPVEDGTQLGDHYAGQASSMGSVTSKPVGRGTNGILMEIPEELYNEDQAAKQRVVDRSEEAMMEQATDSIGGKDQAWHGKLEFGN